MIVASESGQIRGKMRGDRVFDGWLLLATAGLIFVGLLSLFSQGRANHEVFFKKQLINILIGLVPASACALISLKAFQKFAAVLYWVSVAGLALVLKMGQSRNGAERWINIGFFQFQPSEMAKLFLIIAIAGFFANRMEDIHKPSTFLWSLGYVGLPMLLIAKQPHWGATMVVFFVWVCICVAGKVPIRYLLITAGIGAVILGGSFAFPAVFPRIVHGYHANRLNAFLGQEAQKGSNYQTERAMIAIGKGGVIGAGYGKGTQGPFIPEQESDFIFTVPGEELGLFGCTLILALFGFFFYRLWLIMVWAKEPFHKMLAGGILGLFLIHTFVNLFMVMKLLPVIGLWLPFMSYGGTAIWLCLCAVALDLNVERQTLRL